MKHKAVKIVLVILISLILIVIISAGILWNRYVNKYSLLKCFSNSNKQEIYVLGTIHENHFNKLTNYSMEDILNVVENVNPDVVFLEAREKYFLEYGVVDGPVEMSVIYSYCLEKGINVEMVDYWVVDNNYQSNSTTDMRDDNIFNNITNKLNNLEADRKVLTILGGGHLYEQSRRFLDSGYVKVKITNIRDIFKTNHSFEFPEGAVDTWEQRAYFYAYTYPDIIENTPGISADIKKQFTGGNKDAFYLQQKEYCELFRQNKLYQ